MDALFRLPLIEVDRQIVETALIVQRRYQLSYWDSQIVAAAERLGADVLYSEDLNHGQIYGSRALRKSVSIQLNRQWPKASHVHPRQR